MSQAAMDYLTDRVAEALSYCAREFDMTVGEAVGTLHIGGCDTAGGAPERQERGHSRGVAVMPRIETRSRVIEYEVDLCDDCGGELNFLLHDSDHICGIVGPMCQECLAQRRNPDRQVMCCDSCGRRYTAKELGWDKEEE